MTTLFLVSDIPPVFIASAGLFPPTILRSVTGWDSKLKSFDAVAILLWRSSKLGEGKKSKEPLKFSSAGWYPPKEKREWLLAAEALSVVGSRTDAARGL